MRFTIIIIIWDGWTNYLGRIFESRKSFLPQYIKYKALLLYILWVMDETIPKFRISLGERVRKCASALYPDLIREQFVNYDWFPSFRKEVSCFKDQAHHVPMRFPKGFPSSEFVPIMFPWGSQKVSQVLNLFPSCSQKVPQVLNLFLSCSYGIPKGFPKFSICSHDGPMGFPKFSICYFGTTYFNPPWYQACTCFILLKNQSSTPIG